MTTAEEKKALRQHIAAIKRGLSDDDKSRASRSLLQKLSADQHLVLANRLIAFWPMSDEIDVRPAIDFFVNTHSAEVYLPVMVGDDLIFRRYTGSDCLHVEPQYGICEPCGTPALPPTDADDVAVIVPGVAFTPSGLRLGRGRGFYDRAFASFPNAYRVGVCYACQLVNSLPTEPHDAVMNVVYWG